MVFNGRQFSFWVAIGDDFHVTKWMFGDLPLPLKHIQVTDRKNLLEAVPVMKAAVEEAVQFKLNAGKLIGSYNLAKCRQITDRTDHLLAEAFGFTHVWDDIELLYVQTVKTDFDVDEE